MAGSIKEARSNFDAASPHEAFNAMGTASSERNSGPPPDEVRAQVRRMAVSDVFANSPQLSAFLLFVVEAVLHGTGERLKGYTIGVEVLRRDTSFNPQLDPIVRVEATRLRRAIGRYYAGPGAGDPVQIDLPRGSYAPKISWREQTPTAVPMTAPPPMPAVPVSAALAPGNGMPMLRIAPFVIRGAPDTRVVAAETLSGKIAEAFAQFDVANVTMASPREGSDYRLDGTVEYRGDGTVDLRFKLVDEADAVVIWSRAFEGLSGDNSAEAERRIITELSTAIVQPFGVISSNDRSKRLNSGRLDPRYRALLESAEALRSFDPAAQVSARERLESLTAQDPNFAIGFSLLGAFYAREYFTGAGARPDLAPPLDRALKAARRGIELKPQAARAYHILSTVLWLRGEEEAAQAAIEKAMVLNPCDLLVTVEHGGRLIQIGEIDRGMAILKDAVGAGVVLPSWSHFSLFLGHYIRGELAEARYHASQLTGESYIYGQLARALIAHADGDAAEAERCVQMILSLQPAWHEDPRREIIKLVNAPRLADRLAEDLKAAAPQIWRPKSGSR